MIHARLAAPRRAALLTTFVLAAAALRAILLPFGDLLSTLAFAACLVGISVLDYPLSRPSPATGKALWNPPLSKSGEGVGNGILGGIAVGALLLAPVVSNPLSGRALSAFWSWALLAAIVATLEETGIRGTLYRHWLAEAGPIAAIGIGALVFALIHLPRYGASAMPLDFAVGLALGGLRALTGRVLPCAIAHTIADWGAWFWA